MEKAMTQRVVSKVSSIIEILMKMLNCSYTDAFKIVAESSVFKAFIEGDNATLYQSAPCCIEDIGRELRTKGIPCAMLFSSENITKAILAVREENNKNRVILENKIMVKVQV